MEADELVAVVHGLLHRGGESAVSKRKLRARLGLASRLGEAFPQAVALVPEQQHLHGAHGGHPVSQETRRQHAGVIEHQAVSGVQKIHDFVKMVVSHGAGGAVEGHKAGAVPLFQGCLGNELRRQLIEKIMCFQQFDLFPMASICMDKH